MSRIVNGSYDKKSLRRVGCDFGAGTVLTNKDWGDWINGPKLQARVEACSGRPGCLRVQFRKKPTKGTKMAQRYPKITTRPARVEYGSNERRLWIKQRGAEVTLEQFLGLQVLAEVPND